MGLPNRSETMTGETRVGASTPRGQSSPKSSPKPTPNEVDPVEAGNPQTAPEGPIDVQEAIKNAHLYHAQTVLDALDVNKEEGLKKNVVDERARDFGPNQIDGGDGVSWVKILIAQIANAMTLVLVLAMAVSFGIKSWIEGGVLAGIIAINVVVGFVQEYSAEKTMNALRDLASPTAKVLRGGESMSIPAVEVVVGDLVEINTGDTVPADLRLIEAMNLETDEALLTGESLPVAKDASLAYGQADGETPDIGIGDRLNMAYTSSNVSRGRALGVAVGIGMNTEIGRIAEALRGAERTNKVRAVKRNARGKALPHRYVEAGALTLWDQIASFLGLNKGTPLQRKLSLFAIYLFLIAVLFAIIVFLANIGNRLGSPWGQQEVAIYAVATGVSMIPASLMAVLAITVAVGARQMTKRHVIVRRSEALEALGGVTHICSDKTGTLTQGKMVVRRAWVPASGSFSVGETNEPFNPTTGEVSRVGAEPREGKSSGSSSDAKTVTDGKAGPSLVSDDERFLNYLNVASLCNLATVFKEKESGEWQAHGDPTECALQTFGCRFGWSRQALTKSNVPDDADERKHGAQWKQTAEYPFDSSIKRMAVTYKNRRADEDWAMMKGAVERVLDACVEVQTKDGIQKLDGDWHQRILDNMEALASDGLRVLALASRRLSADEVKQGAELEREKVESNMVFLGLAGIYDPPRPETAGAVQACKNAGISVHMLTGDHPGTARAIAIEVGIVPTDKAMGKETAKGLVMTASEFDKLSEAEIDALPQLPKVIARCAPSTKVRMIEALHRRGKFVAMTGDGVNDSPSLKLADVGVAMGQNGSDVAKDASDIVLTDDNFASIGAAVEEGRRISDNIRRFVTLLLAQNVGQAIVLLIGLAFKDDDRLSVFPISPIEAIYIVMIASGIPCMALGFQKAQADIMSRPPRNEIFDWETLYDTLAYGVWTGALCLITFILIIYGFGSGTLGQLCNVNIDTCEEIFRARGALFTCLCWFSLILAFELTDFRRTVFNKGLDGDQSRWTSWARTFWSNKPLFWACLVGFVLAFPILYIPVINDQVFLHYGLSWEWAVVFIETAVFITGLELIKLVKRVYFRRKAARQGGEGEQNVGDGQVYTTEKKADQSPA